MLSFSRCRKIQKLIKNSILTLIIFCFSVTFLVNILVPLPNQVTKQSIKNVAVLARRDILADKRALSSKSIKKQTSNVYFKTKAFNDDYNVCNFHYFKNEFRMFQHEERIALLKNETIRNLNKYFDINNIQPFDNLCDVTFTIKTTIKNHDIKLPHILDTWFNEVSSKVCLFYFYLIKFLKSCHS